MYLLMFFDNSFLQYTYELIWIISQSMHKYNTPHIYRVLFEKNHLKSLSWRKTADIHPPNRTYFLLRGLGTAYPLSDYEKTRNFEQASASALSPLHMLCYHRQSSSWSPHSPPYKRHCHKIPTRFLNASLSSCKCIFYLRIYMLLGVIVIWIAKNG